MKDLAGKVAVVTGAASGIGLALSRRFGCAGMKVVMADIERAALSRAADDLAATGVDVLPVPTDTSIEADVNALSEAAFGHYGDIHLLCNNAGVGSRGLAIADLPLHDFEWVIGVNLFGVIYGLHAFLPHMRAAGVGHIVNTASVSGLVHLPRMGPYNASKAAVVALSETLRFELAAEGSEVGVSVLCPSWVRTNITTSDRNRPERFTYTIDTDLMAEAAEYKARRRRQLATLALDPAEVAEQVHDAVLANRFYVLTHPQSVDVFAARAARIVAGENPEEPPQ
jgi:NAD(P)-dependent dehydrogenase (short-subunit alcohol dehydrogenase family)